MISQKQNTNLKKGEQTMYNTNYGNITQQELQELGYIPVPKRLLQRKEKTMYTLKETQQLIKENPYTCNLDEQEQTEILNSKEYNRTFIITSELNTEDYSYPAIDYNITEIL
jgi:hypothetical protein